MEYTTVMDGLMISISGTVIVLAILTIVVFLLEGMGRVIALTEKPTPAVPVAAVPAPFVAAPVVDLPMTDEEKVIVALVAGIAAEEEGPSDDYHVSKITRIS